ncbi:hypothetical protein B0H13DRAFT_1875328 [Mycena leptocephala]|nr:hypothetical protein B0H13DRAFT_1875328 [Mycena leptocephala]
MESGFLAPRLYPPLSSRSDRASVKHRARQRKWIGLGKGSSWSQPSCLHDGAIPEVVSWFNKTSASPGASHLRQFERFEFRGGIGMPIFQWEGRREILLMDQELNTELIIRTSAEQPGNPTIGLIHTSDRRLRLGASGNLLVPLNNEERGQGLKLESYDTSISD